MAIISCPACGNGVSDQAEFCPKCGAKLRNPNQVPNNQNPFTPANPNGKSRTTAGILAILLGGLGLHRFYLGQTLVGVIFILTCWTYIPAIIGLIDGIMLLTQSDEEFYRKPKMLF